jgi:hypothetical protein
MLGIELVCESLAGMLGIELVRGSLASMLGIELVCGSLAGMLGIELVRGSLASMLGIEVVCGSLAGMPGIELVCRILTEATALIWLKSGDLFSNGSERRYLARVGLCGAGLCRIASLIAVRNLWRFI